MLFSVCCALVVMCWLMLGDCCLLFGVRVARSLFFVCWLLLLVFIIGSLWFVGCC